MRILLLGAPGVGKGTQAKLISENFKIQHLSTGDMFRSNIENMTLLGTEAKKYIDEGQLVPNDLTISMVKKRLLQKDCDKGFILDGFPRNLYQAIELELFLTEHKNGIDRAIFIDIPMALIIERVTGRRICPQCGSSYHIKFKRSKLDNKCDICGENLISRSDDIEEIVKERIYLNYTSIKPVIDYYSAINKLSVVSGETDVNDVFNKICTELQAV